MSVSDKGEKTKKEADNDSADKTKPISTGTEKTAKFDPKSTVAGLKKSSSATIAKLQPSRTVSIILIGLIISALMGFLGGWFGASRQESVSGNSNLSSQKEIVTSQGQLINSIAKMVGPSVVSVNVVSTTQQPTDSFFGFGMPSSQTEQSAGTGIIISSDGLILTNRHVVPEGTTSVSVTLSDGTELSNVKVLGRTSANDSLDIAFLKIQDTKGKKLVPAQIGDSSKVQVGDSVVAIGNALGQFQNTVTSGIISGFGRNVQASSSGSGADSENLVNLIQTDAAINEGNSGGPLVNLNGQVIGINTAIAGNAQNIGFSIPINDVKGLIAQIEQTGKLQRPYLGVRYVPLTPDYAYTYNLKVNNGAYIAPASQTGQPSIIDGSPAAKAGLKEKDIITKVDGTNIDQTNSLTSLLFKYKVGDTVSLTVVRDGNTLIIPVTLGAMPTDQSS